jgi:ribosomal protein L34E
MNTTRFGFSRKLPPAKCPDCDDKLGEVEYVKIRDAKRQTFTPTYVRRCTCGVELRWCFPNVWKRYHALPMLDTHRDIIQKA